ncbi:hypothetical protein Goshw_028849 [Gossypium schwendimanii]|uniref:Serine carboxypeptidase S28 family protein n=1 Tax=Gossypium schwendimanii TaxID=34291 RepID=A0A7J9LTD0_GOSSC|nr:hypothetical protein [Gossypium schwendimanii]
MVSGAENSWFVFGISYSGALSAWFRLKFPHLTCGSLASSGVVLAVYNYTDFDKQVGESAGPECKAVLQEITELVDQSLESNRKELKKQFGAAELEIDGDFLYFLADAAVIAMHYAPLLLKQKRLERIWWLSMPNMSKTSTLELLVSVLKLIIRIT